MYVALSPAELVHVVTFLVEGRRFALAAGALQEIVRAVAITSIPGAPAVVEGVISYHGRVLPVLDLRRRLGLAERAVTPDDHLLIAEAGPRLVAIRADRAVDFIELSEGAVEPLESLVVAARYVSGVAKLPDGMVLVQDLAAFLSQAESELLDRALSGTTEAAR